MAPFQHRHQVGRIAVQVQMVLVALHTVNSTVTKAVFLQEICARLAWHRQLQAHRLPVHGIGRARVLAVARRQAVRQPKVLRCVMHQVASLRLLPVVA